MTNKNSESVLNCIRYLNVAGMVWIVASSLFHFVSLPKFFSFGGLILFFATWVAEFIMEQRWRNFNIKSGRTIYFLLFFVFFLLPFLYLPWDTSTHFKRLMEYRYPLLGFGLVGMFGLNSLYTVRRFFTVFIVLACCACLWLISNMNFSVTDFGEFKYQLSLLRISKINAHMGFNFFLNTALVGVWYILFHRREGLSVFACCLYALGGLVCLAMLMMTEGRTGYAMAILLVSFILTYEAFVWRKWAGILVLVAGMSATGFMLSSHRRISVDKLQTELRLCYWKSAVELIKEKPLTGYGISRAQDEFSKVSMKYVTDDNVRAYWEPYVKRIDTHNQYLQCLLETGVAGLLLLLVLYVMPVVIDNRHRVLTLVLMAMCWMQSVFDMFITGQFCAIFCLITLICLVAEQTSPDETA